MSDVDAVDTDDIWDGEFGLDDIVFFCWMSSDTNMEFRADVMSFIGLFLTEEFEEIDTC